MSWTKLPEFNREGKQTDWNGEKKRDGKGKIEK